ncbi:MAG: hypothetical protein ACPIOQ_65460, partial [Promethearchaeia archaeon]
VWRLGARDFGRGSGTTGRSRFWRRKDHDSRNPHNRSQLDRDLVENYNNNLDRRARSRRKEVTEEENEDSNE